MSPNAKAEEVPEDVSVDHRLSSMDHRLEVLRGGAEVKGDCDSSACHVPSWLDREKFDRARELYKKHFCSIVFSHLAGLMLIVHLPSLTGPLISKDNSSNVVGLFRRYLSTMVHTLGWYEGDIWNPEDPAHQSIVMVRGMHKNLADKMNNNGAGVCPATVRRRYPALSQYDMALTQFSYVGLILLYPEHVGMHCSREDLECLIHFWRGIGHLLGMEDRYNLCNGNLDETLAVCRDIMEMEVKPSVRNASKESSTKSRGIVKAVNSFIAFLSWEAMARFWFEKMGLPCDFKMGTHENTGYWLMRLTFGYLLRFRIFHGIFNFLLRMKLKMAINNKEYYEGYLARYH